MSEVQDNNYIKAIQEIKCAILRSRYRAASLANREMLTLYFQIGGYISHNSREGTWGSNAIETISSQLQKELPGLRGFSATNMRYMRLFYEAWSPFVSSSVITDEVVEAEQNNFLNNQQLPPKSNKNQFHQLATDEYVKLPHENPSIGIILCKSKRKKTVEFAFRDISKPMGVANYCLASKLPAQYQNILPDAQTLEKLL